jgi:hypothetical protein
MFLHSSRRYSSCSGVNLSILIPTDSSCSLATRLSRSSGNFVDLFSSVLVVLHHVLGGEGLVSEAHVHDGRWMSSAAGAG